jgi:aminoglycoside phosphotransferase (APT) family kinase protein
MSREYRIISALWGKGVPVARTYGLCQDASVNGADFYVMDFVDGVVLHDADAARTVADADRRALGEDIIDVLAELHVLDPDAVGLGELGRKEAYLERQLKRWTKQYEDTKTDDIQEMEDCRRLLAEKMPAQVGAGIVHGDYRPGNLIVKGRKVAAVLDWELCTLGDVLADVGYLLNNWTEPGDLNAELLPTGIGGFPSRDELCARYTRRTGRDLSGITYYQAFSHWRLCAIQQGVYKRFLMGAMGDQQIDLDGYQTSLRTRAQRALELLGG